MKTLRSLLSFRRWVFVVCAIALLLGVARSDAQDVPLNGIVLNATPNPVTSGAPSATFSAQLSGNSQTPTGTVNFFLSQSSFCDDGGYLNLGTATVDGNGAATLTFIYLYLIPTGATNLCATYSGDFYYAANETTSSGDPNALSLVFTKIVANVTFSAPASAVQNQPVTLTVTTASLPAGGPVPTGSITIADGQANYGPFPLVAGTASFSLNGLAPGEHSYGVNYSGDVNYLATGNSGTLFVEGGLVAVNPPVVAAGSGDTTITLVGQGFAANLNPVAQLTPSNGPTQQLATTYVSPTRLQAVVPASLLTTAQSEALTVLTGTTSSDALTFTIYNKVTDTVAAAATPTTLTYGQTGPVSLGANVTRGSITEASVPSGAITFSIGGNALSATAPLALTAAGGSYNTGSFPNLDSSPGKILSADFNGDGFADSISLGLNNGDYLQLLLSSGLEFFQNEFEVYIGCQVGDFAVADLNKDGIPDIVAACLDASAQTPYGVYILGNGDGTFQLPVAFASAGNSTITSPGYIAAGDFNGDGATDIALIGSTGTLQVFNGAQPFGAFTPQAAATYPMPGGSPVNVLAVDFNQDGKSDLAMLEYVYNSTTGTGYVLVLTSNGDGTFTSLPQQTFTSMKFEFSSQLLAVTDLTGDGYPSLLVADPESTLESGNGALLIYQNSETGQLNTAVEQPVTNLTTVAGTPFPSIGKPAATPKSPYNVFYTTIDNTNMTSPNLSLQPVSLTVQGGTLNPQNGPVISGFAYPSYCDCDTVYVPMALGDFNGDGYLDVVVTANQLPNSNTLQVAPVYFSGDSTASEVSAIPVLPAGQYNLIASYPGDTYFAPGDSAAVAITISQAASSSSISGPATIAAGQAASFVATVNGIEGAAAPTGSVQFFYDGGVALGAPQLLSPGSGFSTGMLSTAALPSGIHSVYFSYAGDGNYLASTSGTTAVAVNSTTPVTVVLSGPPTAPPATQPTITFQLPTAYPFAITCTFTLSVQPAASVGLIDPAVQFAGGGDTFTFTLPANSTTTPTVQLQTGTLAGTIAVTLALNAGGIDVTPADLQPVVIQVPASAPTITSFTLARDGKTLTATIQGYSSTRDMRTANFTFTGASGATINNPNLTVNLDSAFVTWYGQATSDQYGSAFTYIQTFLLTDDATTIGSASVTLVNSIGTSNSKSAQ